MKIAYLAIALLCSAPSFAQNLEDQPLSEITLPANFGELAQQQNDTNKTRKDRIQSQLEKFGAIADTLSGQIVVERPKSYCKITDTAYDARAQNLVTPVRNQGACQSCWAFVTAELLESAELAQAGHSPTLSTQQVLSCSNFGSCAGGQGIPVTWLSQNGLAADASLPYNPHNRDVACQSLSPVARSKSSGFLRPQGDLPSSLEDRKALLKQGLCDHGTLGVFMSATKGLLNAGSTVFNNASPEGTALSEVNHVVELIGWDDVSQAWIVKNSYGDGVGDQGYSRVAYGSRWFGYGAIWIEALDAPFTLLGNDRVKLKPQYQKATKLQLKTP